MREKRLISETTVSLRHPYTEDDSISTGVFDENTSVDFLSNRMYFEIEDERNEYLRNEQSIVWYE